MNRKIRTLKNHRQKTEIEVNHARRNRNGSVKYQDRGPEPISRRTAIQEGRSKRKIVK